MAQLQCQGLTLGYNHALVKNLNFTVHAGDYLCVLGENGSGKSTLMKTLLGLQPPLGGTVVLGDGVRPGEIGYLPQQTQAQRDFPATVREIVRSGCQSRCVRSTLPQKKRWRSGQWHAWESNICKNAATARFPAVSSSACC